MYFLAQAAIVAKAGIQSIKSSQSNLKIQQPGLRFSLRAKSPALWKAGAITSHYSNRETLVTLSVAIKSKNRKCVERHWVRRYCRPAGQADFAALSAPLARNRKQKPESGSLLLGDYRST